MRVCVGVCVCVCVCVVYDRHRITCAHGVGRMPCADVHLSTCFVLCVCVCVCVFVPGVLVCFVSSHFCVRVGVFAFMWRTCICVYVCIVYVWC